MNISFLFKPAAVIAGLALLLTAQSSSTPIQVSRYPDNHVSTGSVPLSSSFASLTAQGNRDSADIRDHDDNRDDNPSAPFADDWQPPPPISASVALADSQQSASQTSLASTDRIVTFESKSGDARDTAQDARRIPDRALTWHRSVSRLPDAAWLTAESELDHTYRVSGRVVDINKIPIPGVALTINGKYRATTDAAGYYTVTDLLADEYTLMPSKPVYSFSPAVRTVNVQTDETAQDFTVEPDLGFRPERDGYSFNNPGQATPDCLAFQQSFSGLDIQCSENQPQRQFLRLFDRYKFSFQSGICTGMAATSLAYYVGLVVPPDPSPTYKLSFGQAWPTIATFHGRQYSKAVLDWRIAELSAWNTTDSKAISQRVDEMYRRLRHAVQPGNSDPVVIDLISRTGCEPLGHTVAPYRLDETDPLHPRVYIYENFAAGDSSKFIQFDFSSPTHRFSYWKWDSTSCGALALIPVSAFASPTDKIPSVHLEEIWDH